MRSLEVTDDQATVRIFSDSQDEARAEAFRWLHESGYSVQAVLAEGGGSPWSFRLRVRLEAITGVVMP